MHRTFRAAGLLALALTLAACGGDADNPAEPGAGPASGTCLEGTPDCDDTGILDGDGQGDMTATPAAGMCAPNVTDCDDTAGETHGQEPVADAFDDEAAIAQAQQLLGLTDTELGPDVRVGRQGEEHMMLIEDYRLGRMTVELDINDMDEWIVTAVTVELTDAPQTFTRHLK